MAEQDDNWLGSWFSAAKDKSSKVFEFVKKDLEEFGNAVKNEATNVVSTTGNVLEKTFKLDSPDSTASSMKRSFSSFLGQMNTVLNPTPDDSDTEAILIIEDSGTITLNKLQRNIYELQKNAETFIKDPDDELRKKYECWLEIIDDDQLSDERINKHLKGSVVLRNQYSKLVPEIVPHHIFWKRYLFKKALIEDEIAHEEALEKRDKKDNETTENNLKWEQEEFAPYIELTEEEQIKLLEEYENEIKTVKNIIKEQPRTDTENNCPTNHKEDNIDSVKQINKIDTETNLDTNSESSTDGDWEKISDVDK